MKKVLVMLALGLTPVCAARAQEPAAPLRFRVGDAFKWPVKTVRVETARFVAKDGERVEGPRVLAWIKRYAPDGRTAEHEAYAPDGSLLRKTVLRYGGDGHPLEESIYDARGALTGRKTYVHSPDETLTFDGAGRLLLRRVVIWNARRDKMKEVLSYNGAGALVKREVNSVDEAGKQSTWTTYGPDGKAVNQAVHSLNYGGPHRTEQQLLNADGSVAGRRVATSDAGVRRLEVAESSADGAARRKTSQEREYDSHGNLSRLVDLRWSDAKGAYEPVAVTYYVMTYYGREGEQPRGERAR